MTSLYTDTVKVPFKWINNYLNPPKIATGNSNTLNEVVLNEMCNSSSKILIEIANKALKFTPAEAKQLLKDLTPLTKNLFDFHKEISLHEIETNSDLEIINNIKNFINSVRFLEDTLNIISMRDSINEESTDYNNYLFEFAQAGLKTNRVKTGNSLSELLSID